MAAKIDPKLYDEALKLLRESPSRQKLQEHFYWPWKRRAEAFLKKVDAE